MLKILQNLRLIPLTRRTINIRWYSDGESSDDEKKKKQKVEPKQKENKDALKRLNELLESMPTSAAINSNIIRAKNKREEGREKKRELENDPKNIKNITKKIAEKIGGDVQKTEAELLSALLGTTFSDQKSSLNEVIGGLAVEPNKKSNREKHKDFSRKDQQQQQGDFSRKNQEGDFSRAQMVRRAIGKQNRQQPREMSEQKIVVNLFGNKSLNIFDKASDTVDPLKTWSSLEKRELKLAVTHPPRNYFEKMAQWTDQGKVWKFPIDNEQGMDLEKQTDFTEHIMLDMHLEDWCPSRGPVRHFMELVCVGLSKNNFLSAEEKKDHILWYKQYFEEKKDTLGVLMSLGIADESVDKKQIE